MTHARTRRLLLPLALLVCAGAARADLPPVSEAPRWSVGLMFGAPTALTAKRYLGGANAFDIGFGGALGPGVRVFGDYLLGLAQLPSESPNAAINVYLGAGPMLGVFSGTCAIINSNRCGGGDVYLGMRVPFGVEAVFRRTPLALGIEVAPGIIFYSGGGSGTLDLALTIRLLL
jgi:hypothetical protein